MGFKKVNHFVKKHNLVLPEAHAYIIECKSGRESGYAVIGVFNNRQDAENPKIEPYETKRVDFSINRKENDRSTAYQIAKQPKIGKIWNENTNKLEDCVIDEMFSDWQDDIVW